MLAAFNDMDCRAFKIGSVGARQSGGPEIVLE
jgi:hypothetical protein